jgi:hypothetical protein
MIRKLLLSVVACVVLVAPVFAQRGAAPQTPSKPAPRLPDGRPDFSGLWDGGGFNARALKPGDQISFTPWGAEVFKKRGAAEGDPANEDPNLHCLPSGVPRMSPYPWRIIQTPTHTRETHIFILFEGNIHSYRQIFMDGRKHPEDPDPTWYGHSVGRWEGDTLVVDTVGFNDKFWFDFTGHPHTEKLHIVERYRRSNMDTLEWEITIDDPGAYTKPFTLLTRARLQPNDELMEYICQENNTSPGRMRGPARTP